MARVCRIARSQEVIAHLAIDSPESVARVKAEELFSCFVERDLKVVRQLYARVRLQHRADGKWVDEHSPLRDMVDGRGLKLVERSDGTHLSRPGDGSGEGGKTDAHRWVQSELVRLGRTLKLSPCEAEYSIQHARVDVIWRDIALEVDLSNPPPGYEEDRAAKRSDAKFRTISIVDAKTAVRPAVQALPRWRIRRLAYTARAAVERGGRHSLAKCLVNDLLCFDRVSMEWHTHWGVSFGEFCKEWRAGRYRWHRTTSDAQHAWVRCEDLAAETAAQQDLIAWAESIRCDWEKQANDLEARARRAYEGRHRWSEKAQRLAQEIVASERIIRRLEQANFGKTEDREWCITDAGLSQHVASIPLVTKVRSFHQCSWPEQQGSRLVHRARGTSWNASLEAERADALRGLRAVNATAGSQLRRAESRGSRWSSVTEGRLKQSKRFRLGTGRLKTAIDERDWATLVKVRYPSGAPSAAPSTPSPRA